MSAAGRRDRRRQRQRRSQAQIEAAWARKTSAQLLSLKAFLELKEEQGLRVLGVMGYAGPWRDTALKAKAHRRLEIHLREEQERWGPKLMVSSGATNRGVLRLVYVLCQELEIRAMGVTPAQTLAYPVGHMEYLLPIGQRYGSESAAFLGSSDAFLLLGGGKQSHQESLKALKMGKVLSIIRGFGGVGDELAQSLEPRPELRIL